MLNATLPLEQEDIISDLGLSCNFTFIFSHSRSTPQFDAIHYFSIFRFFFEHYPWACSRGGECKEYRYLILYSLFSHIPFSTIVYIYLQRHFLPLTTTTVHTFAIFTIERGPVYLWELRCKVSPKPITNTVSLLLHLWECIGALGTPCEWLAVCIPSIHEIQC